MTKPRYAKVRADWWTHPKTAWMRSIHRDLCTYMAARNHLGVLDTALVRVSSDTGEPVAAIESALGDLVEHGLVRAYTALGVWWYVEAADENLDGRSWQTAARAFSQLPLEVRASIYERYNVQIDPLIACKSKTQLRTLVRVSVSEGVSVSGKRASAREFDYEAIAAALGEERSRILGGKRVIDPNGEAFREQVRKAPGATTESWITAIRRQARSLEGSPEDASKYLTTSTIHRKNNWQRLMERDDLDEDPATVGVIDSPEKSKRRW